MISRLQHRKIMETYIETGNISASALKGGVDRKTARGYIRSGQAPGKERQERNWRTRPDPFEEVWPAVQQWLSAQPDMAATSILEELQREHPGKFEEGQLRTLQRQMKQWRLENGHGTQREVFFEQEHVPGQLLQLDWFHPKSFSITIGKEAWKHLICHVVLTYSNWEWAMPCVSESFASLKVTLQEGLWRLGAVPEVCQVDNSSTATHQLARGRSRRGFNDRFVSLLGYYGMQPRTIKVGAANQNGDVESSHQHLRSYLKDQLSLRGSSDFESVSDYEAFLEQALNRRNLNRQKRLGEELGRMRALPKTRLTEYEEVSCQSNRYGLVRVGQGTYSIPSRYRGQQLRAHIYERRIELWHNGVKVAGFEGSANAPGAQVDWRHLIVDLCRKPGAFERYRYRASFYPNAVWRECYDHLRERFSAHRADSDYLQLLRLSMDVGMDRLEPLLEPLMQKRELSLDTVRRELGEQEQWRDRSPESYTADLGCYDALLSKEVRHG